MTRQSKPSTIQLWQERLQRFQRSHMTVTDFCAQEGFSHFSFYYWRKRLSADNTNSHQATKTSTATKPAFHAVQLTPAPPALIIELPNGVRLLVPADQTELARTLLEDVASRDLTGGR